MAATDDPAADRRSHRRRPGSTPATGGVIDEEGYVSISDRKKTSSSRVART